MKKSASRLRRGWPWLRILVMSISGLLFLSLFAVLWWAGRQTGQHVSDIRVFQLRNNHGELVTPARHDSTLLLVYFGFTYCPDACPTTLAYLAAVIRALEDDAGHVQVGFISIDPQRDTPERIGDYLAAFDPRFMHLHGTNEQIEQAKLSFGVIARRTQKGDDPNVYNFDHTDLVYVLDRHGRQVTTLGTHLSKDIAVARLRQFLPARPVVVAPAANGTNAVPCVEPTVPPSATTTIR